MRLASSHYRVDRQTLHVSPKFSGLYLREMVRQNGYRSGEALQHHAKAVHDGAFDSNCRACRELRAKTEKAQK